MSELNHPGQPDPPSEIATPDAKAALHTRRAFLFKLSVMLNAAVGVVLAVPLVGYLLGPALKKTANTGAWIALGGINDFPVGETRLADFRSPVASFDDAEWVTIVRLDEACRLQQVGEGHFHSLADAPSHALTLTIPALCAARRMLAIVPERRKAAAVATALQGPIATSCPASYLRRQAHCTLFLDDDSASSL